MREKSSPLNILEKLLLLLPRLPLADVSPKLPGTIFKSTLRSIGSPYRSLYWPSAASGDGDLRMRENVSWPLLFFKILENADGLTRKIRLKEEGGDDRRIREKDEGDDDLCTREYEAAAAGDLRILVKDDPEVGVLSILVNDMSRR